MDSKLGVCNGKKLVRTGPNQLPIFPKKTYRYWYQITGITNWLGQFGTKPVPVLYRFYTEFSLSFSHPNFSFNA